MDYLDLTGDYETDFPNIQQMFRDLANVQKRSNKVGQTITHTFSGTAPEVISHSLEKTPTEFSLLDQSLHGTIRRTAWDGTTITLESSVTAQVITFYVE
jgi:hypothetical protein